MVQFQKNTKYSKICWNEIRANKMFLSLWLVQINCSVIKIRDIPYIATLAVSLFQPPPRESTWTVSHSDISLNSRIKLRGSSDPTRTPTNSIKLIQNTIWAALCCNEFSKRSISVALLTTCCSNISNELVLHVLVHEVTFSKPIPVHNTIFECKQFLLNHELISMWFLIVLWFKGGRGLA